MKENPSSDFWHELHTGNKSAMETGPMLFAVFFFYSNIKIADQWRYLLYLRGVISFPRFSDEVFSKIQWG